MKKLVLIPAVLAALAATPVLAETTKAPAQATLSTQSTPAALTTLGGLGSAGLIAGGLMTLVFIGVASDNNSAGTTTTTTN